MSAQANKDLILKIYGAMATGEIQPLLDNLTDDIAWTHQIDRRLAKFGGTHMGIAAVEKNFREINAAMPPQAIEGLEMTAEGDRVIALCRITRRGPSGQALSTHSSHHFTFRDGKIASFLEILDTTEVLNHIQDSDLVEGCL